MLTTKSNTFNPSRRVCVEMCAIISIFDNIWACSFIQSIGVMSELCAAVIMSLQHCSAGSRPLFTSQQLARGCSRCQRQLAHTCMRTHSSMNTHTETHTPLVCLVATVTQKSSKATNLQTTYDAPEFPFPAQAQMCVRKWALKGSKLTPQARWINRIALITC